ncbi:MAG: Glu/Leu/Phe/Val dehydrogenase [Candidatus Firestonebacteria bacterium]
MSIFDLDIIKSELEGKENLKKLLLKSEEKKIINLNIWVDNKTLVVADAFVVYHNTARGPAKGGVRIDKNVTLEETTDLAERMTLKTALAGIPFGGGKTGICLDSVKLDSYMKKEVMKELVHIIRGDLLSGYYIPAPDMGTGPREMAAIYGELHISECVTGKPIGIGGLPGRKEATGRGVAFSASYGSKKLLKCDVKGLKIAIQGFGNVGSWAAYFLQEMGARIVAVSDINGGLYNPKGFDIKKLMDYTNKNRSIKGFEGDSISNEELLGVDAEILIPAACENVLTNKTAQKVKAKLVVEGANGPTTKEGDEVLNNKGVQVVPDFLANAGGVIASYIEWKSAKSGSLTSAEEVLEFIDRTIEKSFEKLLALSNARKLTNKEAGLVLAVQEVISAMEDRGWI